MTGRWCGSTSHGIAGAAHKAVCHRESHSQPHSVRSSPASWILGGGLHGVAHLVCLELVHVADDAHARARVECFLDGFRKRHVDDHHVRDFETVLVVDSLVDDFFETVAHFRVTSSQVQRGDFLFAEHVCKRGVDDASQKFGHLFGVELTVGSDQFFEQDSGIDRFERVGAEGSQSDRAEVGIAHHDGVRRAPLQVSDLRRPDEVDFGFERTVEAMLPACERAEQWHVVGAQLVMTRFEDVCHFATMNEDRQLSRSDDQIRAVFDLIVISRKTPDERVLRVIDPFNNVNKFATKLIEQSHLRFS